MRIHADWMRYIYAAPSWPLDRDRAAPPAAPRQIPVAIQRAKSPRNMLIRLPAAIPNAIPAPTNLISLHGGEAPLRWRGPALLGRQARESSIRYARHGRLDIPAMEATADRHGISRNLAWTLLMGTPKETTASGDASDPWYGSKSRIFSAILIIFVIRPACSGYRSRSSSRRNGSMVARTRQVLPAQRVHQEIPGDRLRCGHLGLSEPAGRQGPVEGDLGAGAAVEQPVRHAARHHPSSAVFPVAAADRGSRSRRHGKPAAPLRAVRAAR